MEKTPLQRGARTFWQVLGGLIVGLALAVWNVPGVPEVIVSYTRENFLPLLLSLALTVGIPSALIAWLQNKLGK